MVLEQQIESWSAVETKHKFLMLLGLVAGIFSYYFFMERADLIDEISSLDSAISDLDRKIVKAREIEEKIPIIEAEIRQVQANLDELLERVPRDASIDTLLAKLTDSGARVGVEMQSFSPLQIDTRSSSYYEIVPVKMAVKGSFVSTMLFFDMLTRFERIIKIRNIQIGGKYNYFSRLMVVTKFEIEMYVYNPNKQAVASKGRKKKRRRRG